MARRNPAPELAISDLAGADQVLAELARTERELERVELELNEAVERAKRQAEGQAAPLKERRERCEAALVTYATAARTELFARGKSLALTHGQIGFRASEELKPMAKLTWAAVLENLRGMAASLARRGLPECIRRKEEPDRQALRELPEELREAAGVRVVRKDRFFYEVNGESLA